MEFKTLALSAMTGVSMTLTALAPAIQPAMATGSQAIGSHHPTITPIYCDKCDGFDGFSESGGVARIVSVPSHGLQITFGETDPNSCTYVGAHVVAQPGATNWSVNMQSQGGSPFFTEYQTTEGPKFTQTVSSISYNGNNVQATFNGPALGFPNFTNLFIYDNGFGLKPLVRPDTPSPDGFTDTIDLSSSGIQVNGIYPLANMVSAVEDCSGIFSNLNISK